MQTDDKARLAYVRALVELAEEKGLVALSVDGVSFTRGLFQAQDDQPEDKDAAHAISTQRDRINGDAMDESILFASSGG